MKFVINKENLKLKANRFAKYSCSGPGKFAVFIILCIIIVAALENLGLTNKERNLDTRKVNNLIKFNIKKHTEEHQERINNGITQDLLSYQNYVLNEKIKNFSLKNLEEKNMERGKMLFSAAVDQFIYENKETDFVEGFANEIEEMSTEEKLNMILSELNSPSPIHSASSSDSDRKQKCKTSKIVSDDINFFGI